MKEFRLDEIPEGRGLLMASRILVFALAMGVVVFGGVAAGVVFMGPKDAADVGLPIVSYVMAALAVITLMIVSVAFIHSKWLAVLAIPAMLFPFIFLADMWVWLWYYGNHLDPTAALSSSIDPFTPAILGTGVVGQFSTTAVLLIGWYLALLASILTGVGLHFRRQARLAVARKESSDAS